MAAILESTDKNYSINGVIFPLNSCSIKKIDGGIRVNFISYADRMDILWQGTTLNGLAATSIDQLYTWFKEHCFSLAGGGDGNTGSQFVGLQGIMYEFTSDQSEYQNDRLKNVDIYDIELNGAPAREMVAYNKSTGTLTYPFNSGDNITITFQ